MTYTSVTSETAIDHVQSAILVGGEDAARASTDAGMCGRPRSTAHHATGNLLGRREIDKATNLGGRLPRGLAPGSSSADLTPARFDRRWLTDDADRL